MKKLITLFLVMCSPLLVNSQEVQYQDSATTTKYMLSSYVRFNNIRGTYRQIGEASEYNPYAGVYITRYDSTRVISAPEWGYFWFIEDNTEDVEIKVLDGKSYRCNSVDVYYSDGIPYSVSNFKFCEAEDGTPIVWFPETDDVSSYYHRLTNN